MTIKWSSSTGMASYTFPDGGYIFVAPQLPPSDGWIVGVDKGILAHKFTMRSDALIFAHQLIELVM